MQMVVIKTVHEKSHYAVKQTENNLENEFYIPKVKHKIKKGILNHVPSILINQKCDKNERLLHPIKREESHCALIIFII